MKLSKRIAPGDWSRIFVPVSGGKDSQVCLAMAVDEFGADRVLGIHQHTGFDHPLTYEHMRYMEGRYRIEIMNTKSAKYEDIPDVMLGEVMVPSRFARMCTRQLKTDPWFKWLASQPDRDDVLVVLGMRAQESQQRMANYGQLDPADLYDMGDISGECPAAIRETKAQLPIVDLSTNQIFEFLRERGDRVNPLYAQGHKRVGCFPCIMAGAGNMRLTARDPVGRENMGRIADAVKIIQWARPELHVEEFSPTLTRLEEILAAKDDPFGFYDVPGEEEDTGAGCSWCNL